MLYFGGFCRIERVAPSCDATSSRNFLADNQVVFLHETVALREYRQYITVKLESKKYDNHAKQIGEKEACELREANMLSK